MTGYPPKCPQNGNRHFTGSVSDLELEQAWTGDTWQFTPGGPVWELRKNGSWHPVDFSATDQAEASDKASE